MKGVDQDWQKKKENTRKMGLVSLFVHFWVGKE